MLKVFAALAFAGALLLLWAHGEGMLMDIPDPSYLFLGLFFGGFALVILDGVVAHLGR